MPTEQDHFDATLRDLGLRAPEPTLGQSVNDYRRETLRSIKRTLLQNHDLYKVNCRGLSGGPVLTNFETDFLKAAKVEAFNPASVPKGELRMIASRDPNNGQEMRRFVGQHSFVVLPSFGTNMSFAGGHRPGRRVVSFRTISDHAGRATSGWV
jgi:hypothetical protein